MSKKQLSKMADAYSGSLPKKKDRTPLEYTEFAVGFTTKDFACSTNGDKGVKVTARISKEDFDRIIYSYGVYIAEYLKEKNIVL